MLDRKYVFREHFALTCISSLDAVTAVTTTSAVAASDALLLSSTADMAADYRWYDLLSRFCSALRGCNHVAIIGPFTEIE